MMKRREEGFTLIELMIVVAIIAILAAIAIPQYLKYRESAKLSAAKANCEMAIRYISQEVKKVEALKMNGVNATYPTADDIVNELGENGTKKSPFNPDLDAFITGTSVGAGQVAINYDDASGNYTIKCDTDGDGNSDTERTISKSED